MEGGGDDVAGAVEAVGQRVGGAARNDADPQVGPTRATTLNAAATYVELK